MKKKKNMYEDLEMIELEDLSDMADIFCEVWHRSDKMIPVALVADRELVEYVMDLMINSDATYIKYINLTEEDDDIPGEWMIMIDKDGGITAEELMFYSDLDKADTVFISMEGDISQNCIDYCLAHNNEVHLFGYPDEECTGHCCDCKHNQDHKEDTVHYDETDDGMHGFTASRTTDRGSEYYSFYCTDKVGNDEMLEILKGFGF